MEDLRRAIELLPQMKANPGSAAILFQVGSAYLNRK